MQYEWPRKIKNPETLFSYAEDFFKKRFFNVRTVVPTSNTDVTKILAIPTLKTEIRETIKVEVRETPEGIAINFVTADKADESVKLGLLSQILIGGALLLKGVNTKEKIERLENEFWTYIQEFIAGLGA
jgi:hypothetical protein